MVTVTDPRLRLFVRFGSFESALIASP